MTTRVAIGLVHYPVLDRGGGIVTTAMTNLDLHDIARSAVTYGASDYFVIHPIEAQRMLASRIVEHWVSGSGRKRIPDRATALEKVRVVDSLESTYQQLGGREAIEVWTTAALARDGQVTSYQEARNRLKDLELPVLILFGTGWGLAPSVIEQANVRLEPIRGASDYNHLSVRAACAISLDRLLAP